MKWCTEAVRDNLFRVSAKEKVERVSSRGGKGIKRAASVYHCADCEIFMLLNNGQLTQAYPNV
jgi:hypothetical protein